MALTEAASAAMLIQRPAREWRATVPPTDGRLFVLVRHSASSRDRRANGERYSSGSQRLRRTQVSASSVMSTVSERMYFCLDAYLEERPNSGTIHYVPNSSKGAYMSISNVNGLPRNQTAPGSARSPLPFHNPFIGV